MRNRLKYFRDTKTGEVYSYSIEDLEQVDRLTESSPKVFHEIKGKLGGMVELTRTELEKHINPKPTIDQLSSKVRSERNAALVQLDDFVSNPLRYAELSSTQQKEADDYRQALLSVPQQESFPKSYVFPEVPTWLQ